MERLAVYPGSFDPITYGHLDILERAVALFERVVIAIVENPNKSGCFTPDERMQMIRQVTSHLKGIEIDTFSGLLVDYVAKRGAQSIIRGLRAVADFDYEFQLASMNRRLAPRIDTVFLMTDESHFYVSSSLIKEVAKLGGDVSHFVPPPVLKALKARLIPV